MSSESTDDFGVPSVEPSSDVPVFMSRREARAARDAGSAAIRATAVRATTKPVAAATPPIPVAPAAVVRDNFGTPVVDSVPVVVNAASAVHDAVKPADIAVSRPRAVTRPKSRKRNPVRALASMAVIGGLFAVAGLPAYGQTGVFAADGADVAAAAVADVATVSAQSVTVSADLALPELERDKFEATSPEDLEIINQQAAIASANALYVASGARALGDDYPWPTADDTLSPLNYYYRQCTDFVAWRLNRDVGSYSAPFRWAWADLTPAGGDAYQWRSAWEAHGWTVSATPVAGSVAWFGWDNHVSYVKQVNADGSVLLEEYNYTYRAYGQRTLAASDVEAFLYPPGQ